MNHIADVVLSQKVKSIPTEIYSRISGYCRPVNQWNAAKREEFSLRRYINIQNALNKPIGDIDENRKNTLE